MPPPDMVFGRLALATVALSFLSSCWHSFYSEDYVREEELPCEEEEEDDGTICWFLGKILLYYCLVVAFLMALYHALERMHENREAVTVSSGCWIKHSKEKRDSSRKGSGISIAGSGCAFCCRLGICSILRKLFGEKEKALPDSPSSSGSHKRCLSKRISKISQQTFCDSDSEVGSLESQQASWKVSRTDSLSFASLKEVKVSQEATVPRSHWTRDQPCLRCKAKRTKAWLVQHFFQGDLPPQES